MSPARTRAAVATIPAHLPFLDTLAAGLEARMGADPLALARVTVLLPTRRACRSLGEAFLRRGGGRPILLPRLVPVGDLDVEELAFHPDEASAEALDIPPAISELKRRLLLARLILAKAEAAGTAIAPGQAAILARALARFLDEAQTEGADFANLAALVPADHARHWQDVLEFLGIVTARWPEVLAGIGALDPAERRNRVLAAQAETWRRAPPEDWAIAAGITGGVPAVAELMEVVAHLPHGEVVLPGLDRDVDPDVWEEIRRDPAHPQHLMARFLDRLDLEPAAVPEWSAGGLAAGPQARQRLVSVAMLPASLTDRWRTATPIGATAIAGFRRLDCAGAQEEAQVIALLLRQSLERDGGTAALVTPDRALARRVAAEVERWDIEIDDSAGIPLNQTPPGVFLRLVLDLVANAAAPVPLLAALKHPFAAGGRAPEEFRALVRDLERAALRGVRPAPGFQGILDALGSGDAALRPFIEDLARRLQPLVAAIAAPPTALRMLVAAHVTAAEALAADADGPAATRLWREHAGEAAAQFIADLLAAADDFPAIAGVDYPALFETLLAGPVVRPRYGRHPRLAIWGLLEAQLQRADLMILGGLNEGVWPPDPGDDPWMSRPMRHRFGIAPPERRIGLAAHDFAQALGAPEVVLTRAMRSGGTPTVPSRWLLRLETVLRAAGLDEPLGDARDPLDWQAGLDRPQSWQRVDPPAPRPPVAARPRRLSVTEVERWMRDPYAIYARRVLGLEPLDPLDAEPDAGDLGTRIHRALDAFVRRHSMDLPPDAEHVLLAIGRETFGSWLTRPGVWAFWWPRFARIAHWFVGVERARRAALARSTSEIKGALTFEAPGGPFTLVAKADRIDRRRAGGLVLIDYKTGVLPKGKDVPLGLAPQLPLEAVIARAGGFGDVAPEEVAEIAYWGLSGGDPAGEIKSIAEGAALRILVEAAAHGLKRLVSCFDDPATPYRAVPNPKRAPRFSDYAHLERVKEWRLGGDEE